MIKATDRKLVVGLEIGTAKVATLVGEILPDGVVNIIGVGSCPSRGMAKYRQYIWRYQANILAAKMKLVWCQFQKKK